MTRYDMLRHIMFCLASYFIVTNDVTYHDVTYHDVIYHDVTYHDVTYHDVTYHDVTYHDVTCHDVTYHDVTYHATFIRQHHFVSNHVELYYIVSFPFTSSYGLLFLSITCSTSYLRINFQFLLLLP